MVATIRVEKPHLFPSCPLCREPIKPNRPVASCPQEHSFVHAACAELSPTCPALGCGARISSDHATWQAEVESTRSGRAGWAAAAMTLMLMALIGLGFTLAVQRQSAKRQTLAEQAETALVRARVGRLERNLDDQLRSVEASKVELEAALEREEEHRRLRQDYKRLNGIVSQYARDLAKAELRVRQLEAASPFLDLSEGAHIELWARGRGLSVTEGGELLMSESRAELWTVRRDGQGGALRLESADGRWLVGDLTTRQLRLMAPPVRVRAASKWVVVPQSSGAQRLFAVGESEAPHWLEGGRGIATPSLSSAPEFGNVDWQVRRVN